MHNTKGILERESEDMEKFIAFLRNGGFLKGIDEFERTPSCMHVLRDFTANAPENHGESLNHLSEINKNFRAYREHAVIDGCVRCMTSLGAILTFKGYYNQSLFPGKIRKILSLEYEREMLKLENQDSNLRQIFPIKLPAPTSGNFGAANVRLVYGTKMPIAEAVEEFKTRIQEPLDLKGLTDFVVREKKSPGGKAYFQADTHHKREDWHTYISIRSKYKTR